MGAEPGLDAATRGGRPVSGDWMGEVGEAESSEDEASEESDSARPRRAAAWMGMGLLCGTVLSALEDIVYWFVRGKNMECRCRCRERGAEGEEVSKVEEGTPYMNRDVWSEFD
jgi:hypothetical protein